MATKRKFDHSKRRWGVRGVSFPIIRDGIWWTGTGFVEDEEFSGLFTKRKAQEILGWLCSPEGKSCQLDGYAYDITLLR